MTALLTVTDAAALLHKSVSAVRRGVRSGQIPAYRIGGSIRFRSEDLESYVVASRLNSVKRNAVRVSHSRIKSRLMQVVQEAR